MATDKRPSLDEIFGTAISAVKPINTVADRPSLDEIFGNVEKAGPKQGQPETDEWGTPIDPFTTPVDIPGARAEDYLSPAIFEQQPNAKAEDGKQKSLAGSSASESSGALYPVAEPPQESMPQSFISPKVFEEYTAEEKMLLDVDKATDLAFENAQKEANKTLDEELAKSPIRGDAMGGELVQSIQLAGSIRKVAGADAVIKSVFESISADDVNAIIDEKVKNNPEFKAQKQAFDNEVKRIVPNGSNDVSDADVESLFAQMTPEERAVAESQIAEVTQQLETLAAQFTKDVEGVYNTEAKGVEAKVYNRIIDRLSTLDIPKSDLEYIGKAIYNNSLIGTLYELAVTGASGGSGVDFMVAQQALAKATPSTTAKVAGGAGAILADTLLFAGLSLEGELLGVGIRALATRAVAGQIMRKVATSTTKSAIKQVATRIVEKNVLQQFASAAASQAVTLGSYNGLLTAAQETLSPTGENGEFNWRNVFHRAGEGAITGAAVGGITVGTAVAKSGMYRAGPDMAYTAKGMAADVGIGLTGFAAENLAFVGLGSLISGEEFTAEALGESFATLGVLKGLGTLKRIAKGEKLIHQPDFVERTISDLKFTPEEMKAMREAGVDMEVMDFISLAVTEMNNVPYTESRRSVINAYNTVMASREIPTSAKVKLKYIVTGEVPKVVGPSRAEVVEGENGVEVRTYDYQDRLVQIRPFENTESATKFISRIQPLLEQNIIVDGAKTLRGADSLIAIDRAIDEYMQTGEYFAEREKAYGGTNTGSKLPAKTPLDKESLMREMRIYLGVEQGTLPEGSESRIAKIVSLAKNVYQDSVSALQSQVAKQHGTTVAELERSINVKPDLRTVRESQLVKAYVDGLKQFNESMSGPIQAEQARYSAQMQPQIEQGAQEVVDTKREADVVRQSIEEAAKRMATSDGKQIAIVRLSSGEEVAVYEGRIVIKDNGEIDTTASENTVVVKRIDADGNEKRDMISIDNVAEVVEFSSADAAVEETMSVIEAVAVKKQSLDNALAKNGEQGVEVVAAGNVAGKVVGIDENGLYIFRSVSPEGKEVDVPISINEIAEVNTELPTPATTEQGAVQDAVENVVGAAEQIVPEVVYDEDFSPLTEEDLASAINPDNIQWDKLSQEEYADVSAMVMGDATTLADSHIYYANSRGKLQAAQRKVAEQQKVIDKLNSRFATLSSPTEAQRLRKEVAKAEQEKAKREQAVKDIEQQMAKYAYAMKKYGVEVTAENDLLAERAKLDEERVALVEADKQLDQYEADVENSDKKTIVNTEANRKYVEQLYADRFGVSPAQAGIRQSILWDLANGAIKLRWDNTKSDSGAVQRGLMAELGVKGAEERRAYTAVIDNKRGQSVDAYVHDKWQSGEWVDRIDTEEVKAELLDILQSIPNGSMALKELLDMSGVKADREAEISLGKGDVARQLEAVDAKIAANEKARADFRKRINDTVQKLEKGEPIILPVGEGEFGPIYDQFKGKPQEAVDFLLAEKNGEAIGALTHPEIGDVSLVYGNKFAGLEKIAQKHPEVLNDLQNVLSQMSPIMESANRIKLESPSHFAVVSKEYMGAPRDKWLLTAYEKKSSASNNRMDTDGTVTGRRNDTATSQDTTYSESKDTTTIPENQISEEKIPKVLSLEQYLGELGLSSPMSDYMIDKTRQPHLRTQSQKNKFEKDAKEAMLTYAQQREQAIVDYKKLVDEGRITPPSNIDRLIASAHGHNDLESTQAARRQLAKRGIDWESGLPKETPFMIEQKPTEKPMDTAEQAFIRERVEIISDLASMGPNVVTQTHEEIKQTLSEYKAGAEELRTAIVQNAEIAAMDSEYEQAIRDKDYDKALSLLDAAAEIAMPDSKVRDNDGKLIRVTHYTNAEFTEFDPDKIGSATDYGAFGRGFYFGNKDHRNYGSKRYEGYLNLTNPIILNGSEEAYEFKKRMAEFSKSDVLKLNADAAKAYTEHLKAEGYDGVIFNDELGNNEYVAFYPNQFKLADVVEVETYDNNGNIIPLSQRFNFGTNDIRFAIEAYHGSGADFEKFDHKFMGTGEGAQVYGYGTYVTTRKGIAENYAETIGGNKQQERRYEAQQNLLRIRKKIADNNQDIEKKKREIQQMQNTYAELKEYISHFNEEEVGGKTRYVLDSSYIAADEAWPLELPIPKPDSEGSYLTYEEARSELQKLQEEIDGTQALIDSSKAIVEALRPLEEAADKEWRAMEAPDKIRELSTKIELHEVNLKNQQISLAAMRQRAKIKQAEYDYYKEELARIENEHGTNSPEYKEYVFKNDYIESEYNDIGKYVENSEAVVTYLEKTIADEKAELAHLKEIQKPFRNLYTVEVPDNTGGNYISWDKEVPSDIIDRLDKALEQQFGEEVLDKANLKYGQTGQQAYKKLELALGSDKAVSEFLHNLGFVGVEYPAQYTTGGRADGAKNYVIFNADDVKIVDHIQYLKTPQGVVYGFTIGDTSYIDIDELNPETPVHEYTEWWSKIVAKNNPKLWARGKELLKETDTWKEVNEDPNYKDLSEDLKASETLSRIAAKEAGKKMSEVSDNKSLIAKLRAWIRKFWGDIKATFAKWSKKDLQNLTVNQFSHMPLRDLFEGVDLRKYRESKLQEAQENSLVGIHNISQEKLQKALKQGGLANPSAAVIDIAKQNHEGYGEYSLILPKALVETASGRNLGTFTGDAWTPTYPSIIRQLDSKGWETLRNRIATTIGDKKELLSDIYNGVREHLEENRSPRMEYVFLKEKGIEPELKYEGADGFLSVSNLEAISGIKNITSGLEAYEQYKALSRGNKYEFNRWALAKGNTAENAKIRAMLKEDPSLKESLKLYDDLSFSKFDKFVNDILTKERNAGKIDKRNTLDAAAHYVDKNGLREEFDAWLDSIIDELGAKEVFFAGYNRNGNRIYTPNTLENVSRHMRSQGVQNAYNNGGLSATKATLLDRLTTLSDIRKNKERLQTTDTYNSVYDKLSNRLFNIISSIADMQVISSNRFMNIDYAEQRLQDALAKKDPIAHLNKEYGYDIAKDSDLAKEIKSFIGDVRKMPAKYFETKFERPVMFNEFAAVVAPDTMPETMEKQLRDAGLAIYKYNPDVEDSRRKATLAATASEDIRFMILGEKGAAELDRVEEATTRIDNLAVAREMEKGYEDALAIRLATGWERGADGKWRYEIPDFDSPLAHKIPTVKEAATRADKATKAFYDYRRNHKGSLSGNPEYDEMYRKMRRADVVLDIAKLEHELRKAPAAIKSFALEDIVWGEGIEMLLEKYSNNPYSPFRNIRVEISPVEAYPNGLRGSYNPYSKVIEINVVPNGWAVAYSTLLHELQHAIQYIEGFAQGASEGVYAIRFDKMIDAINDATDGLLLENGRTIASGTELRQGLMDISKLAWIDKKLLVKLNDVATKYGYKDIWQLTEDIQTPFEKYRATKGEVEARSVQNRMGMTPEERRATLLEATEAKDIARKDQVMFEQVYAEYDTITSGNVNASVSYEASEPVEAPTRKPRKSKEEKLSEKVEELKVRLNDKKKSLDNTLTDIYTFLTSTDVASTMGEGVGKAQYRKVIKNSIEAIKKAYSVTDSAEKRKIVDKYLTDIDDSLSQLLSRQRLNEVTDILDTAIYGYTAQGIRTGKRIDEHTREIFDILRNAIGELVEEERTDDGRRKPVRYRLKNRTEDGDITSSFRLRTSGDNESVIQRLRREADEMIDNAEKLTTEITRKAVQLEYTANILERYDNTLVLNEAIGQSTEEINRINGEIERVRQELRAAPAGSEQRKNLQSVLDEYKRNLTAEQQNRANLRHRYAAQLKVFTTTLEQLDDKGAAEFAREELAKAEERVKWRKGVYDFVKNPEAPVLPVEGKSRKGEKQKINWKGLNTRAKINESVFMATFDEMSRDIDINSIPGQWNRSGWYYQFMLAPGGYMERTDWRYKTEKSLLKELDDAVVRFVGKSKFWDKFKAVSGNPLNVLATAAQEKSGLSIQRMAVNTNKYGKVIGGYQENIPLTIGNILYMRNAIRQPNGMAGYTSWGFSETWMQNVANYAETHYPEYCKFFDWVVGDFLPKLYDMQDAIYFKKFGTHLPKTAFYFPFVRDKRMVGKIAEVGEGEVSLPSSVTGNIVERVKTSAKMDLTADAFKVLQDHMQETLNWCAYSELTDKFNSVATSHAFNNILKAQGVSPQKLKEVYEIAVGQGKINSTENTGAVKLLNAASKGIVAGNIVANLNAAAKQIVSGTATLGYTANPKIIPIWAKNFFVPSAIHAGVAKIVQQIKGGEINPVEVINWKVVGNNWKWAIENIPTLRERWEGRDVGFEVLKSHSWETWDKVTSMLTSIGLSPNAFVDMMTCSNCARTVYEYEYPRLLERGRSKEEAHREACVKAAVFVNETQQSSLDGFISSFQSGGGVQRLLGVGLGAYQNSSMAFARNERFSATNMLRMLKPTTKKDMIARQVEAYKADGIEDKKAYELAKSDFNESYGSQASSFIHNAILNNYFWAIAGAALTPLLSAGIAALFNDKDEWEKVWKNEKFRQELATAVSAETMVWQTPMLYNAPITKQLLTYSKNAADGKTWGGIFESPASADAQDLIDAMFQQWVGVKNNITGDRETKEAKSWDRSAEWLVVNALIKAGLGVNPNLVVRMSEGVMGMIEDGEVNAEDVMAVLSSPRGLTRAIAGEPRAGENKQDYLDRMSYIYRLVNAGSGKYDKKFVTERTKEYIDNKDNELYRDLGIAPRDVRVLEQRIKAIRKRLLFFDKSDEGVAEFRALPEAERKKQIEIAKRYDKITKLTKEMYQGILPFDEAGVSKRKQELQKRHDMMREVYDMWIEYNNK